MGWFLVAVALVYPYILRLRTSRQTPYAENAAGLHPLGQANRVSGRALRLEWWGT